MSKKFHQSSVHDYLLTDKKRSYKNTLTQSAHQESTRDLLFLWLILNCREKNVGISENAMRQRPLEI